MNFAKTRLGVAGLPVAATAAAAGEHQTGPEERQEKRPKWQMIVIVMIHQAGPLCFSVRCFALLPRRPPSDWVLVQSSGAREAPGKCSSCALGSNNNNECRRRISSGLSNLRRAESEEATATFCSIESRNRVQTHLCVPPVLVIDVNTSRRTRRVEEEK